MKLKPGKPLANAGYRLIFNFFPGRITPESPGHDPKRDHCQAWPVSDVKAKIASGEQPVFDSVDALFDKLEAERWRPSDFKAVAKLFQYFRQCR